MMPLNHKHNHVILRNIINIYCFRNRSSWNLLSFIVLTVILLNYFFTTFLTKIAAQLTVGLGGNIMWWHHNYIEPHWNDKNDNNNIPKIIHQTYKSYDQVPEKWKLSIKKWKLYHPDWQYIFWSDNDIDKFMEENYKWFYPFYKQYPTQIQRVDVARYFILYHFGGIYCDLDIIPKKNILPLLTNNIDNFLVETPNLGTTNSLFGSKKHSSFLFYVINNLSSYYNEGWYQSFLPLHMKILFSTGPTALWSLYGKFYSNSINLNEKFGILSNQHFGRLHVCYPNNHFNDNNDNNDNNKNILFKNSYFEHVVGNSWHNESSWYINYFLGCQPVTTLFMIGLIIFTSYFGIYLNKYKSNKSFILWFKKHFILIFGSFLFIFFMYSWRFILFHFLSLSN